MANNVQAPPFSEEPLLAPLLFKLSGSAAGDRPLQFPDENLRADLMKTFQNFAQLLVPSNTSLY